MLGEKLSKFCFQVKHIIHTGVISGDRSFLYRSFPRRFFPAVSFPRRFSPALDLLLAKSFPRWCFLCHFLLNKEINRLQQMEKKKFFFQGGIGSIDDEIKNSL